MQITFDEKTHVYTVDGTPRDSVTQILKAEGFIDNRWFSEEAAHRGSYVHKGCELDDKNDLDEASYDPAYLGYLQAWRLARKELGLTIVENELRIGSALWKYTGTLDRTALMDGKLGILDLKTGQQKLADQYQTAGYQVAYEEMTGKKIAWRAAIYLKSDGSYKMQKYTERNDKQFWLSIVTVHNLKKEICNGKHAA